MSSNQPPVDPNLLAWISNEYHDANGSRFETLDHPPSPLEFSRLVHISRPVLIKGFIPPALSRWTDDYLVDRMGKRPVSVAITPNGQADAVTTSPDGSQYFVEPLVEQMTMEELLDCIGQGSSGSRRDEVLYLQSQNGNLYTNSYFEGGVSADCEFETLRPDVPAEVPWCSDALDKPPDAVNLWIGDGRSVTSVHCDPYENIYTVVRGAKHFTIFPPTDSVWMLERSYRHATYVRSITADLELIPSLDTPQVRWASISNSEIEGAAPTNTHPIRITVRAGETLYLPVGWWHHVKQARDVTIALNWWYDAETQGLNWIGLSLLRNLENNDHSEESE
ncbi:Clavaminate synthase-like protein [Coniophora puteana RWD-64-598 SS2]|uniref:Clavaminate synthase-like protein n=1 Tax=Coniophora puteana (strain RWD-64-598) TaxID=741705 RepID=A0A5M3MBV3_CONPW|nr:Clavaminate synthase-like protein [Coniophora puteana RWD-64-598 SS2]EIW76115.1 Clavaminate synthase-like protein [Coniophora puteana RWD-64-598 SS2]